MISLRLMISLKEAVKNKESKEPLSNQRFFLFKLHAVQRKDYPLIFFLPGSSFIVSETGTTISTSQSRMIQSFNNAGFPSWQTQSPGIGFTLPNDNTLRPMQPSGGATLRASFGNSKGQPVNIDGKSVHPPKGTTNTKQYVRDRTHVTQNP